MGLILDLETMTKKLCINLGRKEHGQQLGSGRNFLSQIQ